MLQMIVSRCHVWDSSREVIAAVGACLKPGAWEQMTFTQRFDMMRTVLQIHRENRQLYVDAGF